MATTPEETIVRSEIEIDAPADLVFRILTDLPGYTRWNPFTPRAVSTLEIGAPIDMRVRLMPFYTRGQREFVSELSPLRRRVAWGMHMGKADWGRGHRTQEIVRLDAGALPLRVRGQHRGAACGRSSSGSSAARCSAASTTWRWPSRRRRSCGARAGAA
jgi:hypothetical protein